MPRFLRAIVAAFFCVACVLCAPAARAEIRAELVEGGARGDWAMIAVQIPELKETGELSLRDARGGLELVRPVPSHTRRVLVSVPLLAPHELLGGTWSLDVVLRERNTQRDQARVTLDLRTGDPTYRVAAPAGSSADVPPLTAMSGTRQIQFIEMTAEDFIHGSPLLFAGCDGILLTPEILAKTSKERRMALVAAGVQLIAPRAGDETWERVAEGVWVWPANPVRRPAILEPAWSDVAVPAAVANDRIRTAAMLVGPCAIVAALIARGLFRRPLPIAIAVTVAMVLVGVGFSFYIRHADEPIKSQVHFREGTLSSGRPASIAMIDFNCITQGSILQRRFTLEAPAGACVVPVAASSREYFSNRDRKLLLTETGRFEGLQAARETIRYAFISASATARLPAQGAGASELAGALRLDTARLRRISGGYVVAADHVGSGSTNGQLIRKWAASRGGEIETAMRAWEIVRFESATNYMVWEDGQTLHILNIGPQR